MPGRAKPPADRTPSGAGELIRSRDDRLLRDAMRIVAPGSELRTAIDSIIHARLGALIVLGDGSDILQLVRGGFHLDCPLGASRLYELAKMDGAIILDRRAERIVYANAHLTPNADIPTEETGMRHRTAEQVARQTGNLVICISQRREAVTVFYGNMRRSLEDFRVVLDKANQAIMTLDRYKQRLDNVLAHLNAIEFDDAVTLADVLSTAQISLSVLRIAREVETYVLQLGSEGRLIRMQLDELMAGVRRELDDLILDYAETDRVDISDVLLDFHKAGPDESRDWSRMAKVLGYPATSNFLERPMTPRGYRLLDKVPRLPEAIIHNIVGVFGSLPGILRADTVQLDNVEGIGEARANAILEGLRRMRELSLGDRSV